MSGVDPSRVSAGSRHVRKEKRPGGVDRALGNRPMGDWTASKHFFRERRHVQSNYKNR